MNNKNGGIGTMDLILIVIAVALVAFTVEMISVFRETGTIPDTLVACVFAALGGECGAMAWIKTTKDRLREREWQKQDEEEARQAAKKKKSNTKKEE